MSDEIVSASDSEERLFIAKCHALKAYRSAAAALVVEYKRDADLQNQKKAYYVNPGDEMKLIQPELPYAEYPVSDNDAPAYNMVERLSDYFPTVRYCKQRESKVNVQCPCDDRAGIWREWKRGIPGYSETMYKDDKCNRTNNIHGLRDLMVHLHAHDTPVHSAAFAYLAFMSGDRLPDFGYAFNVHVTEIPCHPYGALIREMTVLRNHQSNINESGSVNAVNLTNLTKKRKTNSDYNVEGVHESQGLDLPTTQGTMVLSNNHTTPSECPLFQYTNEETYSITDDFLKERRLEDQFGNP